MASSVTLSALRRRVRALRQAASDFELETDRMKRDAERAETPEEGPRIRLLVELARSTVYTALRTKLREAEAELATWRPAKREPKPDPGSFGAMISGRIKRRAPTPNPTSLSEGEI